MLELLLKIALKLVGMWHARIGATCEIVHMVGEHIAGRPSSAAPEPKPKSRRDDWWFDMDVWRAGLTELWEMSFGSLAYLLMAFCFVVAFLGLVSLVTGAAVLYTD